jgi:hypothetical protein
MTCNLKQIIKTKKKSNVGNICLFSGTSYKINMYNIAPLNFNKEYVFNILKRLLTTILWFYNNTFLESHLHFIHAITFSTVWDWFFLLFNFIIYLLYVYSIWNTFCYTKTFTDISLLWKIVYQSISLLFVYH